jgi:hypothetical protein
MSEPVERIAKAILAKVPLGYGMSNFEAHEYSRAAIAAMREPTPEMIEAGRAVTATWLNIPGSGLTIAREKMKLRWRAMIDEMVK